MTARIIWSILTVFLLVCSPANADEKRTFRIVYLSRQDDPAYSEKKEYEGLNRKEFRPPIAGVKTALKEAKILGRAMKLEFPLEEFAVPVGEAAADAITTLLKEDANSAFVLDLPYEDMLAVAQSFKSRKDMILFNVRQQDDTLRGEECSASLFHTIASMAMRTDAIAQYLFAMNWRNVLVLSSASPADKQMKASFLRSAQKFGLVVTDQREFVDSNDPREREKNNAKLLTGDADYDTVFIADDMGEFARGLAYATYLPRPLVGAEGLVASSWHWTFERNGAPQLNQRIHKFSQMHPSDEDWASWAAVHSVVEAVVKAGNVNIANVRATLRSSDFSFDIYKVGPGSFRTWDQQLRQAMMLHTDNNVVATAPMEGFLHRYNTFDSLGRDEPESSCHIEN